MQDMGTTYRCGCCGVRVEEDHSPIATYLVTGPSDLHPDAEAGGVYAEDYALPPRLRGIMARKRKRSVWCSTCYAWDHGEDLVTGPASAPIVVVKHSDHTDRATFAQAAKALHDQQAATRAQLAADKAAQEAAKKAATDAAATQSTPAPDPAATPAPAEPDTA
jgi:hypothetical protein